MPQGEMKRQREKNNKWMGRRGERRADVCFPARRSVSLRPPSALHTAEPLWPSQCGDTVARQRLEPPLPPCPPAPRLPAPSLFRCSVQRCSSELRGKFFLAVPLTTGDQPIGIVFAPLAEQHVHALHLLTKICHSKPTSPAPGREMR